MVCVWRDGSVDEVLDSLARDPEFDPWQLESGVLAFSLSLINKPLRNTESLQALINTSQ